MKIGLSLSFCIQDIIEDRVSLDDVVCIIASTKIETDNDWCEMCGRYYDTYWRTNPMRAQDVYEILNDNNRIIQPRTFNMPFPNIAGGHWIEIGTSDHQDVRLLTERFAY